MTVRQVLPAGTSLADTSAAAVKVEDVLRGIDGIKDVQVTSGNAQTGFSALTLRRRLQFQRSPWSPRKRPTRRKLQETVRTELAKVADAGKITVGSQQGGFGTSSTVDITLKAATSADLRTASDAMVEAMDGRSRQQRGGHQPRRQPARGPGQGGPGQGRRRRTERGTGGRRPGLHHQPDPGRNRPDRHQRLPGADRRGHPVHQHRRRAEHPAADGRRRRPAGQHRLRGAGGRPGLHHRQQRPADRARLGHAVGLQPRRGEHRSAEPAQGGRAAAGRHGRRSAAPPPSRRSPSSSWAWPCWPPSRLST